MSEFLVVTDVSQQTLQVMATYAQAQQVYVGDDWAGWLWTSQTQEDISAFQTLIANGMVIGSVMLP